MMYTVSPDLICLRYSDTLTLAKVSREAGEYSAVTAVSFEMQNLDQAHRTA